MSVWDTLKTLAEDVTPVRNAKVAACVVYKGRIVSFGVNEKKSDPFQSRFAENEHKIYRHAEVTAIKNALKRISSSKLAKSTLYVVRVKRLHSKAEDWVLGLAKPCAGCQSCIDEYGIGKVQYSEG